VIDFFAILTVLKQTFKMIPVAYLLCLHVTFICCLKISTRYYLGIIRDYQRLKSKFFMVHLHPSRISH